ncbi:N-acetyltransferase [Vallitalea longa]|uniref:N-acetyltransferase n=1 Tax=Vallitalea longa TaxID=2936439 RepID=A0A9W5YBY8_9FIRM|nr:GNAT family N-acetyltransferase [Vallitalea longa]GKX30672.1 N-acetyltransferase [Vallitalea longa]
MIDFTTITRQMDNVIIRSGREEDYNTIKNSLKGQNKQQNKFDEEEINFKNNYSKEFFINKVRSIKQNARDDKYYLFRVFKKDDGSYIGGVIIKTILRKNFQWAEIGYWLLNQYWGNGYGAEMVEAAIDIAFNELGYHRLEAYINLDNIASQKTAELAGMQYECTRKGFIYENEVWTDNMVYVININ